MFLGSYPPILERFDAQPRESADFFHLTCPRFRSLGAILSCGAGKGNRTLILSMGNSGPAIERCPRFRKDSSAFKHMIVAMQTTFGQHKPCPLYTAPQPAPAPLSEMPYEKRKAIQEGEQIGASDAWFKARHEMLDTVDRRNVFRAGFDRGWNAALAAQGGKDAG